MDSFSAKRPLPHMHPRARVGWQLESPCDGGCLIGIAFCYLIFIFPLLFIEVATHHLPLLLDIWLSSMICFLHKLLIGIADTLFKVVGRNYPSCCKISTEASAVTRRDNCGGGGEYSYSRILPY